MTQIKAIETSYKGYRFRSRLEARWAVFFDAMHISWEYEPEGFETSAGRYLPDFRITLQDRRPCWFEVKPDRAAVDQRHAALCEDSGTPLVVARGIPAGYLDQIRTPRDEWTLTVLLPAATAHPLRGFFVGRPDEMSRQDRLCYFDLIYKNRGFFADNPGDWCIGLGGNPPRVCPDIDRAYAAARSARFEHGEDGAPRPERLDFSS